MAPPPLPTVALAGATGTLGKHVAEALLEPSARKKFERVVFLTRKETPQTEGWKERGATVVVYDEQDLAGALEGVDVLVNTIGPSGALFKDALLRTIPSSQIKLYIPSEFGADHYHAPRPHPEWDPKKAHFALAQSLLQSTTTTTTTTLAQQVKICRIFIGLFLEDSVGPWFGFDTKNGKYEAIHSSEAKVSFTSYPDVARSVAELVSRPVAEVPSTLHLAGDTASMSSIAAIMRDAGAGDIGISVRELEPYMKWATEEGKAKSPENYLRFMMGLGELDHSAIEEGGLGRDNEIVHPGEEGWRWKGLKDLAAETGGRPWGEAVWKAE